MENQKFQELCDRTEATLNRDRNEVIGMEPLRIDEYTSDSILICSEFISSIGIRYLQKEFGSVFYEGSGLVVK